MLMLSVLQQYIMFPFELRKSLKYDNLILFVKLVNFLRIAAKVSLNLRQLVTCETLNLT